VLLTKNNLQQVGTDLTITSLNLSSPSCEHCLINYVQLLLTAAFIKDNL